MRAASLLFLSGLFATSYAHFHLQFPPPRGPFNMPNELNFCGECHSYLLLDQYTHLCYQIATQIPCPTERFSPLAEVSFLSLASTRSGSVSEFTLWHDITIDLTILVTAVGVEVSTLNNPTSFQNFTQAVPFFQVTGEGAFCWPVDLAASNISGLTDGANITIQVEFNGGDGNLFQVCTFQLCPSRDSRLLTEVV